MKKLEILFFGHITPPHLEKNWSHGHISLLFCRGILLTNSPEDTTSLAKVMGDPALLWEEELFSMSAKYYQSHYQTQRPVLPWEKHLLTLGFHSVPTVEYFSILILRFYRRTKGFQADT